MHQRKKTVSVHAANVGLCRIQSRHKWLHTFHLLKCCCLSGVFTDFQLRKLQYCSFRHAEIKFIGNIWKTVTQVEPLHFHNDCCIDVITVFLSYQIFCSIWPLSTEWFCLYWLLKVNDGNILPGQKQTSCNAHCDYCELIGLSCCERGPPS